MQSNSINIKYSIFIKRSPEEVWDYTQNYDNRKKWDKTVIKAEVIQTKPKRIIKLKIKGGSTMTLEYKLDQRPNKTALQAKDIQSSLIQSTMGTWTYEKQEEGTLWTQSNTIVFKNTLWNRVMLFLYKNIYLSQLITAMKLAKIMIEKN
ncbi:MAG: SRPBCC family protein [Bacteroidota bacterium]|nr:SRPBCC family protein [Bacteroidota bacterium]